MARCIERVHNDFGVSFHQCHRSAIDDSVYCRQHHNKHNPTTFTARQHQAEPSQVRTLITLRSVLEWNPMDAPTIKGNYTAKAIFVTRLSFTLTNHDDRISMEATGPVVRTDGSAGLNMQSVWADADMFAEHTQRQVIQSEIHRLRTLMQEAERNV